MVTIRPMVEEDIPAALQLWQALPGIGLRDADSPAALAKYLARNPGCSVVAVGGTGDLVGVSLAGHDGRRGYLHHVAVAPHAQKLGLGRRLVEACLAALKADGIEKVHLWVYAANEPGKGFWKHLGWRERTELVLMSVVTGDNPNA
ncbi:MAG: family N-acetyltransferase [Gemmataceae bacterium]|nr:family N-acetyltransferase [Gemmataceae bacterium]